MKPDTAFRLETAGYVFDCIGILLGAATVATMFDLGEWTEVNTVGSILFAAFLGLGFAMSGYAGWVLKPYREGKKPW